MSTHRHIDKICCVVLAAVLVLTVLFIHAESFGIQPVKAAMGYESRLFDTSRVHTLDILLDDWEGFLSHCIDEEYTACTVVIDNEPYKNVGLRAKGNTSLTQVQSYGNDRYSFKIEFDHYDATKSYHGLDKLCLNNIIQDSTYMKDYLSYRMMGDFGVASPLCSYVYITVNGEDWGLYLAVEGVEESFLSRNYGNDYGELYKPDSAAMGGGPGNGKGFRMEDWEGFDGHTQSTGQAAPDSQQENAPDGAADPPGQGQPPQDGAEEPSEPEPPERTEASVQRGDMPGGRDEAAAGGGDSLPAFPEGFGRPGGLDGTGRPDRGGGFPGGMGSSDVSLIYTDESYDSYSNIFDNAKTDISDSDRDRLIAALKAVNEQTDLESSVDIEQVIRYFVVHNFVLNFDSYTGGIIHNYYLYEEDGRLSMIPWDYNLAFGGFEASSSAESLINYPIDSPVSGGNIESRPMLAWIFSSEEYTALYHRYFSEFIEEQFESGAFAGMIDAVKAMIAPYVEKDPTSFYSYEEFETGIDTLKSFCLLRAKSVRGQLEGTIASTSEGQQSKENFVSAGSLSVSAMGSMRGGRGEGGGGFRPPEFQPSGDFKQPGDFQPPEGFGPDNPDSEEPSRPEGADGREAGEKPASPEGVRPDSSAAGGPPGFPEGSPSGRDLETGQPPNGGMGAPAGQNAAAPAQIPAESWGLLGISAALQLLGIGAALLFRRRKR